MDIGAYLASLCSWITSGKNISSAGSLSYLPSYSIRIDTPKYRTITGKLLSHPQYIACTQPTVSSVFMLLNYSGEQNREEKRAGWQILPVYLDVMAYARASIAFNRTNNICRDMCFWNTYGTHEKWRCGAVLASIGNKQWCETVLLVERYILWMDSTARGAHNYGKTKTRNRWFIDKVAASQVNTLAMLLDFLPASETADDSMRSIFDCSVLLSSFECRTENLIKRQRKCAAFNQTSIEGCRFCSISPMIERTMY